MTSQKCSKVQITRGPPFDWIVEGCGSMNPVRVTDQNKLTIQGNYKPWTENVHKCRKNVTISIMVLRYQSNSIHFILSVILFSESKD